MVLHKSDLVGLDISCCARPFACVTSNNSGNTDVVYLAQPFYAAKTADTVMLKPTDLVGMDYVWAGQPFVDVPSKSSIALYKMDDVFRAQPFVRNTYGVVPPTLVAVLDGSHIDLSWSE